MPQRVGIIGVGGLTGAFAPSLLRNGDETIVAPLGDRLSNTVAIQANRNRIVVTGDLAGTYALETGNIVDVVNSTEVFFNTVPASGHPAVLEELAKYNLSGHIVGSLPGSGFSFLASTMLDKDKFPLNIIESSTAPAASRLSGANAHIGAFKAQIEMASAHPLTAAQKDRISGMFKPKIVWFPNLVSIFFLNTNPVVHAPIIFRFKERMEAGEEMGFYTYCARGAEEDIYKLEAERLALIDAVNRQTTFDVETIGFFQLAKGWYNWPAETYADFAETVPAYRAIKAPKGDLKNNRMVQEDIKRILVFWRELSRKAGLRTPEMDKIIGKFEDDLKEDFMETGWTLKSEGLENASLEEIISYINGVPRN